MKKTFVYAVIFSTIFATGCDQKSETPHNTSISNHTINTAGDQAYQSLYETEEEKELKTIVEKMKLQDPTIVDAYYSFDKQGEKILNVVKEDESTVGDTNGNSSDGSSGLSTFMWSMAGGFAASMLYDSFTKNKGNMNAVSNQYRPMGTNRSTYSQYTANKQNSVKQYRALNSNIKPVPSAVNSTRKLTPVDTTKNVQPLSQNSYRDQSYKVREVTKPKPSTKKSSLTKKSKFIKFGKRR